MKTILRPSPQLFELESRLVPTLLGNQVFPLDNPWNQVVNNAPVSADSAAIIARLGNSRLHPDFGNPNDGNLYGIPINYANASTPKVTIVIPNNGYGSESDNIQVPVPANPVIEGDGPTGPATPVGRGDSHMIIYDQSTNILYETYLTARPTESTFPSYDSSPGPSHTLGQWGAYSLAVWNLNNNSFRTLGYTSADAAGLPIMPGLVRPDEALPPSAGGQGVIRHAIRMTVNATRNDYVFPASHYASNLSGHDVPRMGERFRLKSSFVIPSNWKPEVQAVAQAMKDYGMIVADNGSNMFFQGIPSTSWDMTAMLQLQSAITAQNFEVVDLTPRVTGLSVTVGAASGGTAVTIYGQNFSGAAGNLHVLFGGVAASSFTIVSDSRIDAISPAHGDGTVDVQVQSGSVQNDVNRGNLFFGYGISSVDNLTQFTFSSGVAPPPPVTNPPPKPTPQPPLRTGISQFLVGADGGGGAIIQMWNHDHSQQFTTQTFGNGFTGGVRVAAADFNADGFGDALVGTGPGGASHVQILDGRTQAVLFSIDPFEPSFTGGVFVAAGDLNGDGIPDIAITPDQGGGPRVRVFSGQGFGQMADFFGIEDPNFRGGARAAIGDMMGTGVGTLVVAAGFGGGPRIAAFDGSSLGGTARKVFADFFAFEPSLSNGAYIAVGDIDGDGRSDLVAGGGPGGGPRVTVFDGSQLLLGNPVRTSDFFAGDINNRGGIRVTVKNLDGDADADIIVGAGTGAGSQVTAYSGSRLRNRDVAPASGFPFDSLPGFSGGVFVG